MSGIVSSGTVKTQISVTGLAVQLAITLALGFVAVMVFSLLRPKNQTIYARRLKYSAAARAAAVNSDGRANRDRSKVPPIVPEGWFAWFPVVRNTTVEDLREKVGLDAAIFVHFLAWSTRIFLIFGLVLCCTLIPINIIAWTGRGNVIDADNFFVAISIVGARYTLTWIWSHVAMTWILSFACYFALWRLYSTVTAWRQQWMKGSAEFHSQVHSRTIMLLGVPAIWRGREDEVLSWMRDAIAETKRGGSGTPEDMEGAAVSFTRKLGRLPTLIDDHKKAVCGLEAALEKTLGDSENHDAVRPRIRPTWFGSKVDAITYYTAEMYRLSNLIAEERAKLAAVSISEAEAKSSVVFVTLPTVVQAHRLLRMLTYSKNKGASSERPQSIQPAPALRDVIWANAQTNPSLRSTRRFTGSFITFWVFIAGIIVVSLIASLINLTRGSQNSGQTSAFLLQFVAATITPTVLAIFFLLLPWVFRAIALFRSKATRTGIERDVLRKFFLFLFVNNFIIIVAALLNDLWYSLVNGDWSFIIEQFRKTDIIFVNIGTSLIDVSSFWMSFILIKGLGVLSELAQAVALLLIWFRRSLFVRRPTPRQKREFARPPDFPFAELYAVHIFAFVVAVMFSIVSPIILPFACLNFYLSLIVYKYQSMYVYSVRTETGGLNWFPIVFNRLIAAIVVLQLVMLLATNVALGSQESLALVPLPIFTLIFKWVHLRKCHDRFMYMDESRDVEQPDTVEVKGRLMTGEGSDERAERYTHHAMNAPLHQVMVSQIVAANGIEKHYTGDYIVEGQERNTSQRLRYTIKRRRDSQPSLVGNGMTDLQQPDSDVEEEELYALVEATSEYTQVEGVGAAQVDELGSDVTRVHRALPPIPVARY